MAEVDIDCLVIGAGVVGLACGWKLAQHGLSVVVVEAAARAGEGVSSRNSGVIHAGLYYPPGSLKAALCVRGRDLLYQFCRQRAVPHRRWGKWVVATAEHELPALQALALRSRHNDAGDLPLLDAAAMRQREPALRCVAALDVAATGIVDVAEYVMALSGALQDAGGQLLCHTEVCRLSPETGAIAVHAADADPIRARLVVNAAGLGAIALAQATDGLASTCLPRLHYASGHYYRCHRPVPFSRLVYPLPGISGLGVHLGFDAAGLARFGPDVRFLEQPDYRFDDSRRAEFADAIQAWWPDLQESDLQEDFVGIRPKLAGPGQSTPDFQLQDADSHGIDGLINLFGIESPGLTASLALAEVVRDRLLARV